MNSERQRLIDIGAFVSIGLIMCSIISAFLLKKWVVSILLFLGGLLFMYLASIIKMLLNILQYEKNVMEQLYRKESDR